MALDFPAGPVDGQAHSTATGSWTYHAATNSWRGATVEADAGRLTTGNFDYARLPIGSGTWDPGEGFKITFARDILFEDGINVVGLGTQIGQLGSFHTVLHDGALHGLLLGYDAEMNGGFIAPLGESGERKLSFYSYTSDDAVWRRSLILNGKGNLGLFKESPTYGTHQLGGGHKLEAIAFVPTPALVQIGATGTDEYRYEVIALDRNGNRALPSGRTTTVGNAVLDSTNFNRLSWSAVSGAVKYQVVRSVSTGTPASEGLIYEGTALTFDDTGIAATAYTLPSRNETADMFVDGSTESKQGFLATGRKIGTEGKYLELGVDNTNSRAHLSAVGRGSQPVWSMEMVFEARTFTWSADNAPQRLVIDETGKVGIGGGPRERLSVYDGAAVITQEFVNGGAVAVVGNRSSVWVMITNQYGTGNLVRSGVYHLVFNNEGTAVSFQEAVSVLNGLTVTFSVAGEQLIVSGLPSGNNKISVISN